MTPVSNSSQEGNKARKNKTQLAENQESHGSIHTHIILLEPQIGTYQASTSNGLLTTDFLSDTPKLH